MPPKFRRNLESEDLANSRDVERAALLNDNSDDEDFFLKGPSVKMTKLKKPDPHIDRVHGQVNEVIGVMRDNVTKVLDRGEKLEDLQDKSEHLASSSDEFRTRAVGLRKRMWWNNCRAKVIITVVILIVLTVILGLTTTVSAIIFGANVGNETWMPDSRLIELSWAFAFYIIAAFFALFSGMGIIVSAIQYRTNAYYRQIEE